MITTKTGDNASNVEQLALKSTNSKIDPRMRETYSTCWQYWKYWNYMDYLWISKISLTYLLTFLLCYLLTYLQPKSKMLEHLKISLILQSQANFRVIGVLAETALALLLYISSFRAMPKCPELSVLVKVLAGERCENMIKMWKYCT